MIYLTHSQPDRGEARGKGGREGEQKAIKKQKEDRGRGRRGESKRERRRGGEGSRREGGRKGKG